MDLKDGQDKRSEVLSIQLADVWKSEGGREPRMDANKNTKIREEKGVYLRITRI